MSRGTVLLFWWALGMLLLTRLFADKHSQSNAVLAQLLILVMFLAAALLLPRPIHEVKYRQFIVDRATVALLMNVNVLKLFATFTPTLATLGMERNICEPNIY